jgi:hypothetical protein
MNAIQSAEIMNAELTPQERQSFEYIEVIPPDIPLHVSIVKGWVAEVRQFLEGLHG